MAPLTKKFNILFNIVVVIIVAVTVIFFGRYLVHASNYEETNDAQVESYINPISARVSGYIKTINFEEHATVKQGDTLVIIDDREYVTKVMEAEAALEDVKARLTVLDAQINTTQTGTYVNKDMIAVAKAKFTEKQQDLKRYKNLLQEEAATLQEYEAIKAQYDVAENEYNAARNNLKTTGSKIEELDAGHALLKAELKQREAALQFAKINLGYTVITAPYSGMLGRKTIQEGQQVQAGQSLVPIINEGQKWVTANFKETQIENMRNGQEAEIKIDGFDDKVYHGTIEAIAGSTGSKFSLLPADNSTGNFVKITQRIPVKIKFKETDLSQVKAGMNVVVSVKDK
ncbi:HlyD family efflux transporter periplasmic adaptor subunit [Flavobacterium sp. Sd200]|uniref:HlyD family secretion protein n=1 Tax=Flavobacterium sp. Sd200 TaxID=2692211 RepID=UPI00137065C4|nr:HlyD family secretion protein [Flavobacterium sp. Sd200]MXN90231.1 HlyD family efflux transporter periplasmic adaptor subunit [Flavobacterium sp. Sd200]